MYAAMAAEMWLQRSLKHVAIIESQGGTAVLRVDEEWRLKDGEFLGSARMHMLPIGCGSAGESRRMVFVARDSSRFHACATALLVRRLHSGSGKWQFRRID